MYGITMRLILQDVNEYEWMSDVDLKDFIIYEHDTYFDLKTRDLFMQLEQAWV